MKRFFRNCRIIDGTGGVIEKGWLLIEDNLISGVGSMEQVPGHVVDAWDVIKIERVIGRREIGNHVAAEIPTRFPSS